MTTTDNSRADALTDHCETLDERVARESAMRVSLTIGQLYDAIEGVLSSYRLSNWMSEHGDALGLVDRLCDDDARSIESGTHEIRLIVDEIYNTVLLPAALAAFPVEQHEAAPGEAAMLDWAVGRWDAEVKNRPLTNVHRRSLDDTWRQVVRHCGGDDVSLLGPRHDDLLAANPIKATDRDLNFEPDAQHGIADMANIGYELMQCIAQMVPGYSWCECPTEIVSDLINERDEALAAAKSAPSAPLEGTGNGADERAAYDLKAFEAASWGLVDLARTWEKAYTDPTVLYEDLERYKTDVERELHYLVRCYRESREREATLVEQLRRAVDRAPRTEVAGAVPAAVIDALRFYAHGHHFSIDDDHQQFDTVSGEPQNWLMSERDDDCTMIEDGSIAKAALCGGVLGFEEPIEPVEGEVLVAAPPSADAAAAPADERAAFDAWFVDAWNAYPDKETTSEIKSKVWALKAWRHLFPRAAASQPAAAAGQEAEPVCWITKEQLEQLKDFTSDAWVYWRETGHVAEDDELALCIAPPAQVATLSLTDEEFEDWLLVLLINHLDSKALHYCTYSQMKDGVEITRVTTYVMNLARALLEGAKQ